MRDCAEVFHHEPRRAARHQNGVRSKHARQLCTTIQVGRDTGGGRSSIVGTTCGSRAALPTLHSNFKAKNGLKSSDCRPSIYRMFADTRSIYGRSVYELCDLKIRHWKIAELRTGFGCPANVGRSLNIAAEPRGGGGGVGVTHHTTCYAPAFKKSVERGLFLDIRRRKASSTFLLKKGCFFPLYRHL